MSNTKEMPIKVTFPKTVPPLTDEERSEIIRQLEATQISRIVQGKEGEVKLEAKLKPEIKWDIDK